MTQTALPDASTPFGERVRHRLREEHIPPPHENRAWLAKYRDGMAGQFGSLEKFSETFPVPLRIEITRTRGL